MPDDIRYKIESKWVWETAKWREEDGFYDHRHVSSSKTIEVSFTENGRIMFRGGPTGSEVYYVSPRLIRELREWAERDNTFCICAGTVNGWPRVHVNAKQVVAAFDHVFGV